MEFIGIDFGTSNSLASRVINNKIEFVNYSDGNASNPTIIYFPAKSKQYYIGNEAVENYLVNLEETGIGGRLMLSIKTLLPDEKFDYTTVVGHGNLKSEDLVAKFLAVLKERAEKQFERKFDGVVLGRPVQFPEIAVNRLEKAARAVGFKEVVFWYEPVAAALAHEINSTADELICVVDIGGGTSDICVIETSPTRSLSADRLNDIKAVGGVYQAGDELSARIMNNTLATKFGAGSIYQSLGKELPFPAHIIEKLSKWHRINLLNDYRDQSIIFSIYASSNRPEDVERLLNLTKHHYGFELFQAIDAAKKQLSEAEQALIKFSPLSLSESITIKEFEEMIGTVLKRIEDSIYDTLAAAAVKPTDIKRVLLTGGTSQVPIINRLVVNIFGEEKVLRPDYFSAVATGLGYAASRLSSPESKKVEIMQSNN